MGSYGDARGQTPVLTDPTVSGCPQNWSEKRKGSDFRADPDLIAKVFFSRIFMIAPLG